MTRIDERKQVSVEMRRREDLDEEKRGEEAM